MAAFNTAVHGTNAAGVKCRPRPLRAHPPRLITHTHTPTRLCRCQRPLVAAGNTIIHKANNRQRSKGTHVRITQWCVNVDAHRPATPETPNSLTGSAQQYGCVPFAQAQCYPVAAAAARSWCKQPTNTRRRTQAQLHAMHVWPVRLPASCLTQ